MSALALSPISSFLLARDGVVFRLPPPVNIFRLKCYLYLELYNTDNKRIENAPKALDLEMRFYK